MVDSPNAELLIPELAAALFYWARHGFAGSVLHLSPVNRTFSYPNL